jgi:hypothetical protein
VGSTFMCEGLPAVLTWASAGTSTLYILLQEVLGGSGARAARSQFRRVGALSQSGETFNCGSYNPKFSGLTFPRSQIIDLTRFQVSDDLDSYTKTFYVFSARIDFFEIFSSHYS